MDILKTIQQYSKLSPEKAAIISDGEQLTYQELETYSDILAGWILKQYGSDQTPIIVYGHKEPLMLIAFLACVKSGHAYCPIDISVPDNRAKQIIDIVKPPVILSADSRKHDICAPNVLHNDEIRQIISSSSEPDGDLLPVQDEDTFYIIFTSGSTGAPKGVQITKACLGNFLEWSLELGTSKEAKTGTVFLNQAPFSFDLSVMDLYTCLASGGTLFTLNKQTQGDYRRLFDSLRQSGACIWVSTPSFADMCLADPTFQKALMPKLEVFLFCGEALSNHTAKQLKERFPDSTVVNTYGPTESTVALTEIVITDEILSEHAILPVGRVKKGSRIEIQDDQGSLTRDGVSGEIVLIGNTVSTGYYHLPEQTQKSFFQSTQDGHPARGYRTGDCGYLIDGMLYYQGRIDLQIKLHGYRIELEDIEQNILKASGVRGVVVTPNLSEGKVKSLTAHIVYDNAVENRFQTTQKLKEEMKQFLPDYMIPKKIQFLEQIPMTVNGKADRQKLGGNPA